MMPRLTWHTTPGALAIVCALAMLNLLSGEEQDKKPASEPVAKTEWKVLCDGKSLKDWAVTKFGGEGAVEAKDGAIEMKQGNEITGITWAGAELPKRNYEVSLESKKIDGSDFFCGVVFRIG